jgi:hypothetical protein
LARDSLLPRHVVSSPPNVAPLPELKRRPQFAEGQALWRVGQRSFLVQHLRTEIEYWITDSDQNMAVA